jgi:hypothetical protein
MGKALVTACLLLAACQSMYGEKPVPLKNPVPHKPPTGTTVGTADPIPYVDQCNVNFTAPPLPDKKREIKTSVQLTLAGDSALQTAPAPTPITPVVVSSTQQAIDRYREALVKDPYNAEATLKLALAYDRVLRKGCVLALMHRLDALASAAPFDKQARPMIDLVEQNPHWFGPYHREALAAAGR